MPLVERAEQLGRLLDLAAAARRGRGSLALLGAEAGAGKSTLVRELAERAEPYVHVLIGCCDPLNTPRPLSPLIDIALDHRSRLSAEFAAAAEPFELFTAIQRRVAAADPKLLLVIEDVHWADEGTLDFLRFAGRRVGSWPTLIVVTFRSDELTGEHPARRAVGELLGQAGVVEVTVPPLSVAGVRELAGARAGEAEHIRDLTGGNAFFVTEVLASQDGVPSSVREAVLARIVALEDGTRGLVEVVAGAPRSLDLSTAMKVAGVGAEAVDEATSRGVLLLSGSELRFRHELARNAVESVTPLTRQFAWHRALIDELLADDTDDMARLAHHAARAHAWDLLVQYAPLAASQAEQRGSSRQAAEFLRLALERGKHMSREMEAEIRAKLADLAHTLDLRHEALEQAGAVVEIYSSLGDTDGLAVALGQLAYARFRMGLDADVMAPMEEALELVERDGRSLAAARVFYQAAMIAMFRRRLAAARSNGERALQLALAHGSRRLESSCLVVLGASELVMGDGLLGVELLERAMAVSRQIGNPAGERHAIWMLGTGGGEGRLYDVATRALTTMVDTASSMDDDSALAYGRAWQARVAFDLGRYDEADRLADLVPPRMGRGFMGPITALGAKGRTMVRTGRPGARDVLLAALATADNASVQYVWSPVCGLVELAWLEGRPADEASRLSELWEVVAATDSPWAKGEISLWAWKCGLREDALPSSASPFADLIAGRWEESARAWERIGCPYESAFALAHGDTAAMRRAHAAFLKLGAGPAAAWVRSRLREQGVTNLPRAPRRADSGRPGGLTERQLEVLGLLVRGLTNTEIASRLGVSDRTAEHHVSAVLERLEVPNRAAAVATAMTLGLVDPGRDADHV